MRAIRDYTAYITYIYYGTHTTELPFSSNYRANSKGNRADAMRELRRRKERGICDGVQSIITVLDKK